MDTCTPEFERLASKVGGLPCDTNPFITLRSPFSLDNWTMPVIELLLVSAAIAALIHALRWRRKYGDSTNLVVWVSGVFALLLVEPIAYFPQWWGLQDSLGLTFIHNQFSVQFLFDRLPLYIVAMYPAYGYLSYILVQRTGILERYHPVIGAVCVAFVFHCAYEVIDTVGVQFRWWVWNTETWTAKPSLGVVPYLNIQAFSLGIPFGMALLARLTRRLSARGPAGVVGAVAIVSVGVWPLLFASDVVWLAYRLLGASSQHGLSLGTWTLVITAGLTTAATFIHAYRARRTNPSTVPEGSRHDPFALACVVIYLIAAIVFWAAALPDYLDAKDGLTPDGAPIGSFPYAVVTLALSTALTLGAYLRTLRPST